MRKIPYDTQRFRFAEQLLAHFGWGLPLNQLHRWLSEDVPFFEDKTHDQSTAIHKHFYSLYDGDSPFLELYHEFLREVVLPCVGEGIVFQAKPTFRICLPDNLAVGEWHKDSDYDHPRSELSWWLPLTDAYGTNTVWSETEEDKGDFQPIDVEFGEVLNWKSAVLQHGNKTNETGVSRVSLDFRVIPFKDYAASSSASSHMNLKFEVGGYYGLMNAAGQVSF
jgi:hypothetical protein